MFGLKIVGLLKRGLFIELTITYVTVVKVEVQ